MTRRAGPARALGILGRLCRAETPPGRECLPNRVCAPSADDIQQTRALTLLNASPGAVAVATLIQLSPETMAQRAETLTAAEDVRISQMAERNQRGEVFDGFIRRRTGPGTVRFLAC